MRPGRSGGGTDEPRGRERFTERSGRQRDRDRDRDRDRRRTAVSSGRERRAVTSSAIRGPVAKPAAPATGWNLVRERLRAGDPAFAVTTLDRALWIEPFTGRYVPLAGEVFDTARGLYRDNPHLAGHEALPLATLMELRWTYDIKRLLAKVSALRIFTPKGNCWLNPYTGLLDTHVHLIDGILTGETQRMMAKVLSECRQADGGAMLERTLLELRCREFGCAPRLLDPPARPVAEPAPATPVPTAAAGQAGAVQRHLLAELPTIAGYRLAVHYSTVEQVSSDLYEVSVLPDGRVRCILGDITGHGMAGALLGATAIKALRMLSRTTADTVALLSQLNVELKPDLPPGQFITLAVATLDPDARTLDCVLAGHHPFVIANRDSTTPLRLAGNAGMAIGLVGDERFTGMLHPVSVQLLPGDLVLQYSDGLVEARNRTGDEFGLARLYAALMMRVDRDPRLVVDGLAQDAARFSGGSVEDDLTVFAIAVDRAEGTNRHVQRKPVHANPVPVPVVATDLLDDLAKHEAADAAVPADAPVTAAPDLPDPEDDGDDDLMDDGSDLDAINLGILPDDGAPIALTPAATTGSDDYQTPDAVLVPAVTDDGTPATGEGGPATAPSPVPEPFGVEPDEDEDEDAGPPAVVEINAHGGPPAPAPTGDHPPAVADGSPPPPPPAPSGAPDPAPSDPPDPAPPAPPVIPAVPG